MERLLESTVGMRALTLLLAALVAIPSTASAQADPPESPYEDLFDDVERGDLADARRDHMQLERIVDSWRDGVANDDEVSVRAAESQLLDWLDAELGEDRTEIGEARREVDAARREAARTELLDDRLDLAQERAQLVRTRADLRRTQTIAKRLARAHAERARDAQSVERLIVELTGLAQDELDRARAETESDREEALERIEWRRTHGEAR